jgi:hypothetical protein
MLRWPVGPVGFGWADDRCWAGLARWATREIGEGEWTGWIFWAVWVEMKLRKTSCYKKEFDFRNLSSNQKT